MTTIISSLLVLLFFLSGPVMKGNAEIWHSPLAAEGVAGLETRGFRPLREHAKFRRRFPKTGALEIRGGQAASNIMTR